MAVGGVGRRSGYGWVPVVRRDRAGGDGGAGDAHRVRPSFAEVLTEAHEHEPAPRSINMPLPWLNGLDQSWRAAGDSASAHHALAMKGRLDAYSKFVDRFEHRDQVIELILTEARDSTDADGGTFYLASDGRLSFAYFQNESISSAAESYMSSEIAIDESSICGYVALTGRLLNIPDAGSLPAGVPYRFNSSYDESTGYRTVSLLTVPISDEHGVVMGVLQLVNRLGEDGAPVQFSEHDEAYAEMLAKRSMPFLRSALRNEMEASQGTAVMNINA